MASQRTPLLLELLESLYRDLATALERRQRQSEISGAGAPADGAEHTQMIAKLEVAVAGLEGALDRRENDIVH